MVIVAMTVSRFCHQAARPHGQAHHHHDDDHGRSRQQRAAIPHRALHTRCVRVLANIHFSPRSLPLDARLRMRRSPGLAEPEDPEPHWTPSCPRFNAVKAVPVPAFHRVPCCGDSPSVQRPRSSDAPRALCFVATGSGPASALCETLPGTDETTNVWGHQRTGRPGSTGHLTISSRARGRDLTWQ